MPGADQRPDPGSKRTYRRAKALMLARRASMADRDVLSQCLMDVVNGDLESWERSAATEANYWAWLRGDPLTVAY